MKKQETDQEKTYAKHVSDKELISRIYKEPSTLIQENPIKNGQCD